MKTTLVYLNKPSGVPNMKITIDIKEHPSSFLGRGGIYNIIVIRISNNLIGLNLNFYPSPDFVRSLITAAA